MTALQHDWIGIFNPHSGGAQLPATRALKEGLTCRNIPLVETKTTGDLQAQVDTWINQGGKGVILCGGDGSLHQGVNAVYNSRAQIKNVNLAFLPSGTGNDWATYRGLSKDPDQLLKKLSQPSYFYAPIGHVKSLSDEKQSIFVNIVGIGFDAFVVKQIEKSKKRSKGIYIQKVVTSLNKYTSQSITWDLDGLDQVADVFSMHIGIGKTAGGGMKILPHARDDSKNLAVTIVRKARPRDYLRSIPKLLKGGIQKLSFVEMAEATRISVEGDPKQLGVECDGEYFGTTPVEIIRLEDNLKVLDTR